MSRTDISYDVKDFGLEPIDLQAKYFAFSDEHPEYTLAKWKKLLSQHPEAEEEFNGYWDWAATMISADATLVMGQPEPGTAQQVTITDDDMVDLDNIDQFAFAVGAWHQNKVATLRHMTNIPAGTEMEVTIGDQQVTLKLEGEVLAAFQAGIELALIEFGQLPFVITTEEVEVPVSTAPNDADAANSPQG